MNYEHKYTWQHFYQDSVLMHNDGACSVMIAWDGFDTDMMSQAEAGARFSRLQRLLDKLPTSVTSEWHQWREPDDSLARAYYQQHTRFVRAQKVGRAFRESMANHLGAFGINNQVALVLTWHVAGQRFFPKRALLRQAKNAEHLLAVALQAAEQLPGAHFCSRDMFLRRLHQSYNRAGFVAGLRPTYSPQFFINEQVVVGKPTLDNGLLKLGDQYTKTLLLFLYPDAFPGLCATLLTLPVALHISHVVRRVDVKAAMKASERSQNFANGTVSNTGTESKALKSDSEGGFRAEVNVHGHQVFQNTFIIHMHHSDPAELRRYVRELNSIIESPDFNGRLRDADDVQLLFWRHGQPAQGYRSSWSRRDHTQQVGDMLPVQVFGTGTGTNDPQMLRMGHSGHLIGFSYEPDLVNHSVTVAMTGGGKGVNKVAQILETYPLGIDWYIMEVGTSYQWTVEALGGTYLRIDPGETIVNPFPLYTMATQLSDDNSGLPRLPIDMMTGTAEALAPILTGGVDLLTEQTAVIQAAFTVMYAAPADNLTQPTFETFLNTLHLADNYVNNEVEAKHAVTMSHKLESFLSTAEGRIFAQPSNFNLSDGITGVDLLLVKNKAKQLMRFYLVFLSLTFMQRAFSSPHRSRILLDEMHEYVKLAPDVIKPLVSGLARMGRKDGGSIDLVSQETEEFDQIERAVINQCPWQTFLFRKGDHHYIAERTSISDPVVDRWLAYQYPVGLPYRPAIQRVGDDYHDLYLTFPEDVLLLASSDKSDLEAKELISLVSTDPFERNARLKAHQSNRKKEPIYETV